MCFVSAMFRAFLTAWQPDHRTTRIGFRHIRVRVCALELRFCKARRCGMSTNAPHHVVPDRGRIGADNKVYWRPGVGWTLL